MGWDEERFNELETRVKGTMSGRYAIADVPFFRFMYGPGEGIEHTCVKEFKKLAKRIDNEEGLSAECLSFSRLLVESLGDMGFLTEDVLRTERQERPTFMTDLENSLPQEISKRLIERLKAKDRRHCAVLLRLGSLFPFVRISQILQKIDSAIRCVLIVPYPGSREGEMLWDTSADGNSYYRWQTV
jgi:hypothetical protein